MRPDNHVVIVGGGAAGLSAALFASKAGAQAILLEKNEKFGKKLYITGKGRCNICNACDTETFLRSVQRNPRFLYSALRFLSPDDLQRLMTEMGCPVKVERGNRVFPASDHASDVSRAFLNALKGQALKLRAEALEVLTRNEAVSGVRVRDDQGEHVIPCACAVIATGGLSYPSTGSTGDGLRFARELGHTVNKTFPSLVPLVTKDEWPKKLQGLSLKNVCLTAAVHGKIKYCEQGEMLFTHFGVSGPLVLRMSSVLAGTDWPQAKITLDLKPALSPEQLDARLLRDFAESPRKQLQNLLPSLLPGRMAELFPALCNVDGAKQAAHITASERARIAGLLKALPIAVNGSRPMEEAIVTCGGVSVREINPATMMSKKVRGLFFAGEVLDVDAFTGGFSLQIAFSTGALAGRSAAEYLTEE
ncbi:MAG: NAD(P)/FAD-dependent oxidoreductase [Clostridia bacterium]|nr:NAD(P)/FAD-dependent oxidoreductase [Clostridia bacterium]